LGDLFLFIMCTIKYFSHELITVLTHILQRLKIRLVRQLHALQVFVIHFTCVEGRHNQTTTK